MQDHGFEVRHEENLREHYAMTLRDWCANLERTGTRPSPRSGQQRARVWRLYMAASRFGFDRPDDRAAPGPGRASLPDDARSGLPLRPWW